MHEEVTLARENEQLRTQVTTLTTKLEQVQSQLLWFQNQLFGRKSERRIIEPSSSLQLSLGESFLSDSDQPEVDATETVKSYARRKSQKDELKEGQVETLLRFDDSVPVEVVTLPVPELEGLSEDQYEVIRHEESYKLAQTPSSYVVIKYVRPKRVPPFTQRPFPRWQ